MKKISLIAFGTAIGLALVGIIFLSHSVNAACTPYTSVYPSSLDTFISGDCIPSSWANTMESTVGTTTSATSVTLQVSSILSSLSNYLKTALLSLNGATSTAQTVVGGTGVSVSTSLGSLNSTTTITNTGVTSLNTASGSVTIAGAGSTTVSVAGGTITISSPSSTGGSVNVSSTQVVYGNASGTGVGSPLFTFNGTNLLVPTLFATSTNGCVNADRYNTIQSAISVAQSSTPLGCVVINPDTTDTSTWTNPLAVTIVDERQTPTVGRYLQGGSVNPTLSTFFDTPIASATVIYFGNSTVILQGGGYFATLFQQAAFPSSPFYGMDIHNDVNSLSSNASGTVTVYTTSSSTDITVGKWVYLDNTLANATTSGCYGSGIVTAQSNNSFTFTPVNGSTCASISLASATGYATEQVLNFGNNGATLASMLANTSTVSTGIGGICSIQPTLLNIRGPIINDVRLGLNTEAQLETLEKQMLDTVRSCSPNTDIWLKTENPLLSSNVGGLNYVSPNASASVYSAYLEAVPMSFTNVFPNVVTEDTQKLLYGNVSMASSSATYMSDQLHPTVATGGTEATLDMQFLQNLKNTTYPQYQNIGALNPNTPSAQVSQNSLTPFSPFLASLARSQNYAAPWTANASSVAENASSSQNANALDPFACMDPNYYQLIASGNSLNTYTAGVSTFMRILWNSDTSSSIPINAFDVVEQPDAGCWQLAVPVVTNFAANETQISLGSQAPTTTPYTISNNETISFYRPIYPNLVSEGYVKDTKDYPYRHRIYINNGGTNFFRISFMASEGLSATQSSIYTGDTLLVSASSTAIPLSGCTFSVAGGNSLQCGETGSFSSLINSWGWVVGPQPMEGTVNGSGNGWSGATDFPANVSIGQLNATNTSNVFQVASTTSAGGTYLSINTSGIAQFGKHVGFTTSTPTVSSCGTNATSSGSDNVGVITLGTGGLTSCTLTFATAYTTNPVPIATDSSSTDAVEISSVSTSSVVYSFPLSIAGGNIYYANFGNPN